VVIGEGSQVGAGCILHPAVIIGRECQVGEGAVLHPHVVLYDGTWLGASVEVHAGTVLGSDGFGYVSRRDGHHKVPQIGRVVLEDGVEVGANAAIDRATFGETRIGAGTKIDNLVQVGHNVEMGRSCILSGQAGIAGSARLGDFVVLGGQAGSAGHLKIGDGAQVAAKAAVFQSVDPGAKVGGIPATALRTWQRQVFALGRLPELLRRFRQEERGQEARGQGSKDAPRGQEE
jgi:UDP-3-O-[3-hydroxymyristoyl] glucosamine N-acyltransferase